MENNREIREKKEAPSDLKVNISEASRNTRKLYAAYIGLMAYVATTIISTSDRQLILGEPARLPFVNVGIPLDEFFVFTPILVIIMFVYFHLNLLNLKKMFFMLESNYAPLDDYHVYPWLLNFKEDKDDKIIDFMRKAIISLSLWWAMPSILILNALKYIKKHDMFGNIFVCFVVIIIGLICTLLFWFRYRSLTRKTNSKKIISIIVSSILVVELIFVILIYFSFDGGYQFLKNIIYVDLSYQKLINEENKNYDTLYWIDLRNAHLEGANLTGAILIKADLHGASFKNALMDNINLRNARLSDCDFTGITLEGGNLVGAEMNRSFFYGSNITWANLDSVDLRESYMEGASFFKVSFKRANLSESYCKGVKLLSSEFDGAILQDVNLAGAILTGSYFVNGDLRNSDFSNSNLLGAHLEGASLIGASLFKADLTSAHLDSVELHYAKLDSATLWGTFLFHANLEGATFNGAMLSSAFMNHTNLKDVDFQNADLSEAKLDSIINWEFISDMSNANIWGIEDPPEGFIEFAKWRGAIVSESEI